MGYLTLGVLVIRILLLYLGKPPMCVRLMGLRFWGGFGGFIEVEVS